MTLDCPWCCANVEVGSEIGAMGEVFTCPECTKQFEVDGDYIDSEVGWQFWTKEILTDNDKR